MEALEVLGKEGGEAEAGGCSKGAGGGVLVRSLGSDLDFRIVTCSFSFNISCLLVSLSFSLSNLKGLNG